MPYQYNIETFDFIAPNRVKSRCGIAMIRNNKGRKAIILIDTGNPMEAFGMSITNAAETIIMQYCNPRRIDPNKCEFYEFYQENKELVKIEIIRATPMKSKKWVVNSISWKPTNYKNIQGLKETFLDNKNLES